MTGRTDRIEARVEPERAQRIRVASAMVDESVSSFVMRAATEGAERVIAQHSVTLVDDDYFERLVAALDGPGRPVPALARAVENAATAPVFEPS